jgi:hypothetical protein
MGMQIYPNDIHTLHMDDIRNLSVVVLITITNNGKHYGTVRFVCSVVSAHGSSE